MLELPDERKGTIRTVRYEFDMNSMSYSASINAD